MPKPTNPLARDLDRLITTGVKLRAAQIRFDRFPTSSNRQKKTQAEKEFDTALSLATGSTTPAPAYLSIKPLDLWLGK